MIGNTIDNRTKNLVLTGMAGILAFASSPAYAANEDLSSSQGSERVGYLGALLGENLPNGNAGSASSTNFGVSAGLKLVPHLGVGIYGTYYGETNSGSLFRLPDGTSTSTFNLAGEANAFESVFHFGVDLGTAINSWSGNIGNATAGNSSSALIYGPEAGFDIPIGKSNISIGAEVHYLMTNDSEGQSNLQALGALKVWL